MNPGILTEISKGKFSLCQLEDLCPELSAMKKTPQNPEYHAEGNVFRHTEMVCEALTGLPQWKYMQEEEQALLFLAASFHDIGKTVCTRMEEGAWVSPRHTLVGEKVFRQIAYRSGDLFQMTFRQRELVAKLIRCHGLPVWFWTKQNPDFELFKAAESIPLVLLYLLSKADILGRITTVPDHLSEQVEMFADYAKELHLWKSPHKFANLHTKFEFYQKENLWCNVELFDNTEFDVILMSGLPLSGKDTWIAKNGGDTPVISLDDLREKMGIPPTKGSGKVVQAAMEQARNYLRKKQPFIWNATNLLQETRQKLVRLFAGYGARVHILYLEVPYQELLRRNRCRARHIPEHVLETMIQRFEVPAPWEAHDVTVITTLPI
jgi:predicted kinase